MGTGSLTSVDAPICVRSFSQLSQDGKWRLEALHSHEEHALIWFTKGQGRISIAGINRIYGPNAIVFLPAGTAHAIEAKSGLFGTVALIREHPSLAMPVAPIHLRIRDVTTQSDFVALFDAMQREVGKPGPGHARACLHHAGIMGVWLERQDLLAERAQYSAAEALVRRYADLLEVRFASGATVTQMAEELGVTPTHLTRCCRQTCGKSAHDMQSDRLMYEARDMLLGTELPIKRIAVDLGYRSAGYFTRSFQNHIGITPSRFRASG